MNVGKMADGRWLRADVIPLHPTSYIDVPRSLPILRSHYREKHVAYRSDTHYGVGGVDYIAQTLIANILVLISHILVYPSLS